MQKQQPFRRVILMGRAKMPAVPSTLNAVKTYVESLGLEAMIESSTRDTLGDFSLPVFEAEETYASTDLMIVVGGDGSLLSAAHLAVRHDIPVLGINRGRLGFLTDIHPDELTKIGAILNGYYTSETRFMLSAEVSTNGGNHVESACALNEVVLHPGDRGHMLEYEISIDNDYVCKQRADGLIISTPTGSTAYALSGGGPILHPALNAIALVPMFPHTLSSRPIVIDANHQLRIQTHTLGSQTTEITLDSRTNIPMSSEAIVTIQRHHRLLKLIHPVDYQYYSTLREKLGWEKPNLRSH